MVNICTDSCADLSKELRERHAIRVINLQVLINGENIHDGDISIEELFARVAQSGKLPVTSAPSLADFITFFSDSGDSIFIGISSKLSATLQAANLAAKEIENKKVYVVDSLNLSTGIGLLVLLAADLRDAGKKAEEIVSEIESARSKIRTAFAIDTMEYLYKGGRCTGLQALAGSLLQIRPIIAVQPDGTLAVKHKIRGARQKALNTLLDDFKKDLSQLNTRRVFVTHSGCIEDAAYLVQEIMKLASVDEVLVTTAGATIGSHCGPNTIGILYMLA